MTADVAPAHSHVAREIRRQPEAWARAVGLVPDIAHVLPRPGERIAVIGCGTSWFMGTAYASLREHLGGGETDGFAASHFPAGRRYDRVVAISRSGTTTEVVRAIEAARSPVVAITAVRDCPVAEAATETVVLDFADEESVVQTVFATTALMLLRAALGEPVEQVIAQGAGVLEADSRFAPEVEQAGQFTFLGQDWAYGIALEAALKMREAAQLWTEAYPQMEYRHGPIAIAEPGRAVWVFGRPVPGIAADIAAAGAAIVDDDLDPVADLVRAQLLAARRAEARHLDPDRPRNLTRSVVLG
ncbi:MAG: sugar isomerase [Pseudonocardiales bacterium]|nr:sugar isomerase [Pseudonocardiales bacterium]